MSQRGIMSIASTLGCLFQWAVGLSYWVVGVFVPVGCRSFILGGGGVCRSGK